MPDPSPFHCLHVQIHVKADAVEAFRIATLANARASLQEPGVLRFDFFQDQDDASRFVLVEVYRSAEAHAAHRTTAHYAAWRAAVDSLMAEERTARKFWSVAPPATDDAW
jgi:autoinducer 2-degrading protein